jgi:glycosyltransferase involved in cell wall biosynthesis
MPDAIIVVPCHNEASRLPCDAFRRFSPAGRSVWFLFVNDGSDDGTGPMLDALRDSNPARFDALHLPRNMGKAEAVRQGVLRALPASPRYAGYWDADLATPLSEVEAFCDLLDGRPDLEMVFGARVKLLGRNVQRRLVRHYLGRVFATAAAAALGFEIYDTQCGAKLFRVTPALAEVFREPFLARWIFDVEILARFARQRRQSQGPTCERIIYERPLPEWRDTRGSRLRLRDFLRAPLDLAHIYWRYLRR